MGRLLWVGRCGSVVGRLPWVGVGPSLLVAIGRCGSVDGRWGMIAVGRSLSVLVAVVWSLSFALGCREMIAGWVRRCGAVAVGLLLFVCRCVGCFVLGVVD